MKLENVMSKRCGLLRGNFLSYSVSREVAPEISYFIFLVANIGKNQSKMLEMINC